MNFIKKLCRRFSVWVHGDSRDSGPDIKNSIWLHPSKSARVGTSNNDIDGRALSFKVFSAIGGKVIQFNTYNEKTDTYRSSLYVITEQDDLAKELAEIITVESLVG